MKIKILISCSGLDFSFCAGETVEVSTEIANDLIGGGLAESAETKPKPKAGAKKDADA